MSTSEDPETPPEPVSQLDPDEPMFEPPKMDLSLREGGLRRIEEDEDA